MSARATVVLASALVFPAGQALAQASPPIAQFWIDVATHNMSVPGMGDMDSGAGGMGGLGSLFGGGSFGATKMAGGSPGQWLDSALHTRNKPAGTEGTHAIPPGLNMGASLPLIPVVAPPGARGSEEREEGSVEKPKGRLLFYWGCGETVRPGQPRVLDFSKAGPDEWTRFMTGRHAPDRGAKAVPGRSVWPNERNRQRVPNGASLLGDHGVSGDGVPAGWRFGLNQGYDFMPKLRMNAAGDTKASVMVSWQAIQTAQGYFLTAMGARGQEEMIFWSSSEHPDPGWGLMDYLAPAQARKLVGEKVVLPPNVQNCAVPAGIFGGTEGAMVRMIAYGPELNLAFPPRPANPRAPWNPEWAVRLRIKSTGMAMLGMSDHGAGHSPQQGQMTQPQDQSAPSRPDLPDLGGVIRGIFGR